MLVSVLLTLDTNNNNKAIYSHVAIRLNIDMRVSGTQSAVAVVPPAGNCCQRYYRFCFGFFSFYFVFYFFVLVIIIFSLSF